eukprot:jgi/Ulvmu1/2643/UM014_0095.1
MSKVFSASQYDRSFSPQKLGNWEVSDTGKMAQPRFSTLPARTTKTEFIADDKGYLKKSFKKPGVTAFTTTAETMRPVHSDSKPRWPKENVSWPFAARAVMPSKGIQTGYLPISTVPVKTYMSEGFKDFNFHH